MDFDDLSTFSYATIERLVQDQAEETHRIDFKRKNDPAVTDLSRDDKKSLGEAASGFANAEGGLLVVGVETKSHHGVDRAHSIVAIENIEAVADRYRSYLSECVSPPVEGIEVITLKKDGSSRGVLVIKIPQGAIRPHMSTAPNHHRFYRRVADRFQQMERYEIEEMFRLKGSPKLDLILDYQSGGSIGGNPKTFIRFGLQNMSRATAKFPYLSIVRNRAAPRVAEYGLDGNGGTLFSNLTTGADQEILFSGGANIVLHPGQSLFISRLEYLHSSGERSGRYWAASELSPGGVCSIEFSYGCEDSPRERIKAEFSGSQLLNLKMPRLIRC